MSFQPAGEVGAFATRVDVGAARRAQFESSGPTSAQTNSAEFTLYPPLPLCTVADANSNRIKQ
jgi:hypothetical protein